MNQNNPFQTPSTPASSAEIVEALKVLFNALPFQRGTDPATVILAYVEALRGVALDGVEAGIRKFLRGECEDVNPRYVPTPPELARIIRTTVVPTRVPPARRIENQPASDPAARARMRLKMPMFQYAFSHQGMGELDRANREGFTAMVALAYRWCVEVPAELLEGDDAAIERDWHTTRNRAWAEIERNPPPFMRRNRTRSCTPFDACDQASARRADDIDRSMIRERYGMTDEALANIADRHLTSSFKGVA